LEKTVDTQLAAWYSEECYIMARYAYSPIKRAETSCNKYKKTGVKRQWKKTEFVL
jgi:hypothetical protein